MNFRIRLTHAWLANYNNSSMSTDQPSLFTVVSLNAMKQKIGRKTCFINTFHKSRFYCYVCTYRRSHCDLLPRPLGLRSRQDSSDTGRKGGSRYKSPWDTSYSPHCTACIPRGSIQTQRTAETSLQQTRQKTVQYVIG